MENCAPIPFWNRKNVVGPPITSKKLLVKGAVATCLRLHKTLAIIIDALGKTGLLFQEAAVLSRLIFRNKSTLRRDKGLKLLQMLNQTLKRYLQLNVLEIVTSLKNCCYEDRFPTRQSIEWCLLTLQRFSSLFSRAHSLSAFAAKTIKERLETGHLLRFGVLCLATVSRIWIFTEYYLLRGCEWYSTLKSFEDLSPAGDQPFLPDSVTLPENLDYLLVDLPSSASIKEESVKSLRNVSGSERSTWPETNEPEQEVDLALPYFNEDLGEAVQRKPPKKKRKLIQ